MQTDLEVLTAIDDGVMDEVHALRNVLGADLVTLVTTVSNDFCGYAWISFPSYTLGTLGFSVSALQCPIDILAHELGHNLGMNHDPFVTPALIPFPYGHGYVDLEAEFRTIMAYPSECDDNSSDCPVIQQFSDPDRLFGGRPAGTVADANQPTSDNIQVVEQMAPVIESFRDPVVANTYGIAGQILLEDETAATGATVTLSGDAEQTATVNFAGDFALVGLNNGSYTVTPSSPFMTFSPASRNVVIADGHAFEQDFAGTISATSLQLTGSSLYFDYSFQGDSDEILNPGEYKGLWLTFRNNTAVTISSPYLVPDSTADPFVHPYSSYFFDTFVQSNNDFSPGEELVFTDPFDFMIDGDAPNGHILSIPFLVYDGNDQLIAADTMNFTLSGADTYAP